VHLTEVCMAVPFPRSFARLRGRSHVFLLLFAVVIALVGC
jgi:hypothetical protein